MAVAKLKGAKQSPVVLSFSRKTALAPLLRLLEEPVNRTLRAYAGYIESMEAESLRQIQPPPESRVLPEKFPGTGWADLGGARFLQQRETLRRLTEGEEKLVQVVSALSSLRPYRVEVRRQSDEENLLEDAYCLRDGKSDMPVGFIRILAAPIPRVGKPDITPRFTVNFINPEAALEAAKIRFKAGRRIRDASSIPSDVVKRADARLALLRTAELTFGAYQEKSVHGVRIELEDSRAHINVNCPTLSKEELERLPSFVAGEGPVIVDYKEKGGKKREIISRSLMFPIPRSDLSEGEFIGMLEDARRYYRRLVKRRTRAERKRK